METLHEGQDGHNGLGQTRLGEAGFGGAGQTRRDKKGGARMVQGRGAQSVSAKGDNFVGFMATTKNTGLDDFSESHKQQYSHLNRSRGYGNYN